MYVIKWYDGKHPCVQISVNEIDAAYFLIKRVKKKGWKFVCMVHTFDKCYPMQGFEKNYEDFLKHCEENR